MATTHNPVEIRRVDYHTADDCAALVMLLDAYAQDPMGGAEPLSSNTRATLCQQLAAFPGAASFIAWAHTSDGTVQPVGLINLFLGFSTFKAQPLLNVHDIAVLPNWRGQGISRLLLQAAEDYAREHHCCKITLEVLAGNLPAQAAYARFGFAPYALDPAMGQAQFMQKWL